MNPEHVSDFVAILRRHNIRFVLVGGAAVRHFFPSESQDVDALVLTREYNRAAKDLDGESSVASFSREPEGMATGHFHSRFRLVRFDLLDPSAFSGSRQGDDFFQYVYRHGSIPTPEGRVATVPVVWYMRLVIEGEAWTAQVAKILRDVRSGAPWAFRSKTIQIAARFGMKDRISKRWGTVEEAGRRLGLLRDPADAG